LARIDGGKAGGESKCPEINIEPPQFIIDEALFMSDRCNDHLFRRFNTASGLKCIE
jgi:hypothetical protein